MGGCYDFYLVVRGEVGGLVLGVMSGGVKVSLLLYSLVDITLVTAPKRGGPFMVPRLGR